jgi:hypothetical protein
MGVYIEGIKVGYSYLKKEEIYRDGCRYHRVYSETKMRVSRLGSRPIEIMTIQESYYDDAGQPVKAVVKTKMSEQEMVIQAQIDPETVIFKIDDQTVKKISPKERFYLEVPVEKLIKEERFKKGAVYTFNILNPVSYSLEECHYEILGKEELLILGKSYSLWHTRSKLSSLVPVVAEEWINDRGEIFKSELKTGFVRTTSLKMSKLQALEMSHRTYDIAFSTVIRPDRTIENPQAVQKMKMELSGISEEKLSGFPWDSRSQKIIEKKGDSFIIQIESVIFDEEKALYFPVNEKKVLSSLQSTLFCQSNDSEIKAAAEKIVGDERNSWKAAKKIADWISREMNSSYDVGFASAKDILENREGDCSEHTVLFVALCRSIGIPARACFGVMYGNGVFAYHMWPEVYVGEWVDLDPKWLSIHQKSGEYYTDATHIKFGRTELDENILIEMALSASEIIGKLKIKIVEFSKMQ